MAEFTTPKGTTLPLLNLKGKSYLQVAHRLVWFREEFLINLGISTSVKVQEGSCLAHAEIKTKEGHVLASGHKLETKNNFNDYVEKAETGAIGRALANLGYGTQYCGTELDEGDRIVDTPLVRKFNENNTNKSNNGDYVITFGKYRDKKFDDLDAYDLQDYVEFLQRPSDKPQGKKVKDFLYSYELWKKGVPDSIMDHIQSETPQESEELPF